MAGESADGGDGDSPTSPSSAAETAPTRTSRTQREQTPAITGRVTDKVRSVLADVSRARSTGPSWQRVVRGGVLGFEDTRTVADGRHSPECTHFGKRRWECRGATRSQLHVTTSRARSQPQCSNDASRPSCDVHVHVASSMSVSAYARV
mmetsp:Transcript_27470/g.73977  ORF Transcript_27470/g.73977 Transcript_27470/m.73977 type:complete len:149 (-) Transcript_27470:61-507(-)